MKHWRYYERNIHELQHHVKVSALSLFKGLKRLDPEEVKLLAERYYKSEDYTNFNEVVGEYSTVNPIPYKVIADKYNRSDKDVQEELKRIERKLGAFIIEYQNLIEQKKSKNNIEKLQRITLNKLDSVEERKILAKAFQEIANKRRAKQERVRPQ